MIEGIKELKADFRAIRNANNNGLRNASFAGARVARDALRAATPVRLKKTIVAIRGRGTPGVGISTAGPTKEGFILRFLEGGTQAHAILARRVNKRTKASKRPVLVAWRLGGKFVARKLSGGETLQRIRTSKGGGRRVVDVTRSLQGTYGVRVSGVRPRRLLSLAFQRNQPAIEKAMVDRYVETVIKQRKATGE